MTEASRSGVDIASLERMVAPFVEESLPGGGIDASRSLWQAPGRGSAAGSSLFPAGVDVRYLRYLVDALYRLAAITGRSGYREIADAQARFLARVMEERHPTWAWGNALEAIGIAHRLGRADAEMLRAARTILTWARARSVTVRLPSGPSFRHFPCGYGVLEAKDAGWTNDLSIFGAGLVWAYEATGDRAALRDASSFSEYFLQPWRPGGPGADGYWACGTFREDMGSWVVGPSSYRGFESTDAQADESSWVFSTYTCIDYLCRLARHRPDPRIRELCVRAARWTFEACQFDDGAVGITGRDDKWLGMTGNAMHQVALITSTFGRSAPGLPWLRERGLLARRYLQGSIADNARPSLDAARQGVVWVNRTSSADPMVNVGMQALLAVLGELAWQELEESESRRQ